jgi:arylsulfatase A-like enzyme
LIVLLDDVGVDKVAVYGEHPEPPRTPVLDSLAAQGLLFRNAYANPTCSPTRISVLTGRHPSRTGVGRWIAPWDDLWDLQDSTRTLPTVLTEGPREYDTAAIGKWHMVSFLRDDPSRHPLNQGFATHRGSLANLNMAVQDGETDRGYWYWEKSVQGALAWSEVYATTDTIDDAIEAMHTLTPPWLLYVALNAPHIPAHEPPEELLAEPLPEDPTPSQLYAAMLEAADTELGRLMDSMSESQRETTTLFVAGDNGTPEDAITEPFDTSREKGAVYENGVRVPLIVLGPHVSSPGSETAALVQLTDLFATAAVLGGVDPQALSTPSGEPIAIDGLSLLPILSDATERIRQVVYTEGFYPPGEPPYETHERMVRDDTHKLIRKEDQDGNLTTEFFRLANGLTDEGPDLLAAGELSDEDRQACAFLEEAMNETVARMRAGL